MGLQKTSCTSCESREHQIDLWEKESLHSWASVMAYGMEHRQLFPTAFFPKRIWERSPQGKTSRAPTRAPGGGPPGLWQDSLTTLLRRCGGPGCSRLPRTETNNKKGFFSCFYNIVFRGTSDLSSRCSWRLASREDPGLWDLYDLGGSLRKLMQKYKYKMRYESDS